MDNETRFIEKCYIAYGPMVLRRCQSILLNRDAALDAMQDVFVRLITHRDRVRSTALASYLYRIATNVCLNMIRDNHTVPVNPADAVISRMTSRDNHEELLATRDYIDHILRDETIFTKRIARLYYAEDRTLTEVSDTMGISISCIGKRMRELRRKITAREKEAV